jgi:hypothetical protein
MSKSNILQISNDERPPNAPVSHMLDVNDTLPKLFPSISPLELINIQASWGPAGFICCTVADWVAFLNAHAEQNTNYLSTDTFERLHRPFIGDEGYGLGVIKISLAWALPGGVLWHNGDLFGQNTVFWIVPRMGINENSLVMVAYVNCRSDPSTSVDEVLQKAIQLLIVKYANVTIKATKGTFRYE